MANEVLVSAFCNAYNHESYIKSAIEGFLAQKTNFRYEIIIYDDASTDETPQIIQEYEQKYPDIIHAIYHRENQHSKNKSSYKWSIDIQSKSCKGKYIALCEGDDYWIDCYKLQIQADYMEEHPECSLYIHNALRLNCQDGTMKAIDPYEVCFEENINAEELIMQYKGHPPTASMFYRREYLEMPDFFYRVPVGDYPPQLYYFTQGKVHYSSRIMSVYRWLSKNSYNSKLIESKERTFLLCLGILRFLMRYDEYTSYKYHTWLVMKILSYALSAISIADSHMTLNKYYKLCERQKFWSDHDCETYLEKLECLRKQTFDNRYCSDELRAFVKRFNFIVIMGAGAYGRKMATQLGNNAINYEGFAVSKKKEGEDILMGKTIWNLSDLPFDSERTGVIVAINPIRWDDIVKSLKNAGIKNYTCPFLLE